MADEVDSCLAVCHVTFTTSHDMDDLFGIHTHRLNIILKFSGYGGQILLCCYLSDPVPGDPGMAEGTVERPVAW